MDSSKEIINSHLDSQLLTVKQFSEKFDWPIGGLRHLIFFKPNGFEEVIRRVGRKVLLNECAFFDWIERINKKEGVDTQRGGSR